MSSSLQPLMPSPAAHSARAFVDGLALRAGEGAARPRVVAAMIASADGRASVDGRSVALGHPADRALLRELRAAADAVLVGTATLAAEGYASLLDDDQRTRRRERGLEETPLVATVSRRLELPVGIGLFAEPSSRVVVYTESGAEPPATAARLAVHRFDPGALDLGAVLARLGSEHGARLVLCEGGPTLLRRLVAEGALDDLFLTVSPLLVAGDADTLLSGPALEPAARLSLRDIHRSGEHLFVHYAVSR
ncbi:MAG: bifunctional deaminase-reductase domain protein [Solirubrobacterales bacterium]|nr:bifunctional deaminase-reductase domain protein [Solirubrobacterales bacterium]